MAATSREAHIYNALMTKVGTLVTGDPTLPVSYPEPPVPFDPKRDAPAGSYLEVGHFPNRPAWEGLSDGSMAQGLLQITLIYPPGRGLVAPLNIVGAVKAHFAKGTRMFSGTAKVTVSREPWEAPALTEPDKVSIPITIPWTA